MKFFTAFNFTVNEMLRQVMSPSSAQMLVEKRLNSEGRHDMQTKAIESKDLNSVYKNLNRISEAPDFEEFSEVLEELPHCEKQDTLFNGVIVETRNHPALESVVLNISNTCDIPIQIFHGKNNLEFILSTKISDLVALGKVTLSDLGIQSLPATLYNTLFLAPQFWQAMIGKRKILVFQTDSMVCEESQYCLNDFSHFDYIGGNWNRHRPVGLVIDGGSGGFSIRDWRLCLECLCRFPPQYWRGGEDGYFAFHIDLLNGRIARGEEVSKFCTQDKFEFGSFAAHRIGLLEHEDLRAFFSYSRFAKEVFPDDYLRVTQSV